MKRIKNFKKIIIFPKILTILFHIILLIYQTKSEITECPRDLPILESNECKLIYCDKNQFDTNICQIKNAIIKTQWLNNIIIFGDNTFRYVRFASYLNGDMVIETTSIQNHLKECFMA